MSDLSSDSVDLTLDDSSFNDSDSLISLVAGPEILLYLVSLLMILILSAP